MHVVTFACDDFTDAVQAQLTRDLMLLLGNWDIALWDPKRLVPDGLLDKLGIQRAGGKSIALCIVYKTSDEWPEAPSEVPTIERDLKPDDAHSRIDGDPGVGYYLSPQGKGATNRTEFYLNRAHPKGNGVTNPMVMMMWG